MLPIRLAKYIAHCGFCSRKQASRHIDNNDVLVNGRAANHIDHVTSEDMVIICGKTLVFEQQRIYFAYHKPIGIDCKLDQNNPASLLHHLPKNVRVFPVGRLDKDSRGLLVLTNDGDFCNQLIHPDFHQEKEYLVKVHKPLATEFAIKMAGGLNINGQITFPCQVNLISDYEFNIILKQGLNRQIRKMSQQLGYKVQDLKRIRIGQLTLAELPEGQFIQITKQNILC